MAVQPKDKEALLLSQLEDFGGVACPYTTFRDSTDNLCMAVNLESKSAMGEKQRSRGILFGNLSSGLLEGVQWQCQQVSLLRIVCPQE